MAVEALLVYAIGLDPLMRRALRADLAGAHIRCLRRLSASARQGRCRLCPDLVLLDLSHPDAEAQSTAVRSTWGETVPIVALSRSSPFACVWQHQGTADLIEIGPGFLTSLLA